MLDWYIIEYLYPESYNKFIDTMFPNVGIISLSTLKHYDIKKLYGFFDKEGVFLNVEMYTPHSWSYTISFENGKTICPKHDNKKTREEIEIDGFLECFNYLDKKLRKSNENGNNIRVRFTSK